jgi:hypothetical protein
MISSIYLLKFSLGCLSFEAYNAPESSLDA